MIQKILSIFARAAMLPFHGKITGSENIPKKGGLLFAANHSSYIDHFLIGEAIIRFTKKDVYFLAKKEHFDTFFQRKWHNLLRAIPIDRDAGGKDALAKAVWHLEQGHRIMIYPEGTRTLTGKMNRAKTGAVRLAIEAKVPIVPIGVTNTFRVLPKGKNIPRFRIRCDVHFGKPVMLDKFYGKENDHESLREATTILMKEIAILSNQKYEFDW